MRRLVLIGTIAALVAAPVSLAFDRAQTQALVRVAVKLSGLSAREPVRIVVERPARFREHRTAVLDRAYPRGAQGYDETVYRALGLTTGAGGVLRATLIGLQDEDGLYDPATRTAYVRAGSGERTAALRAVVHALEDQHFRLARLARLRGGDDARLAAKAALEGYAALAMRGLASPAPRARGRSRLARYLELREGFVDFVGLRFASDLRNLGGPKVALGALRRFPATSEQVFHLDKYLEREPAAAITLPATAAGLALRRAGTFGELDVRALLAVFGVPRLDAVGSGWGGGRTALYSGPGGDAVAVVLDWDTEPDARQWSDAVPAYVAKAFAAAASPCDSTACWRAGSRALALDRAGRRTALVIGADPAVADTLARALIRRP